MPCLPPKAWREFSTSIPPEAYAVSFVGVALSPLTSFCRIDNDTLDYRVAERAAVFADQLLGKHSAEKDKEWAGTFLGLRFQIRNKPAISARFGRSLDNGVLEQGGGAVERALGPAPARGWRLFSGHRVPFHSGEICKFE